MPSPAGRRCSSPLSVIKLLVAPQQRWRLKRRFFLFFFGVIVSYRRISGRLLSVCSEDSWTWTSRTQSGGRCDHGGAMLRVRSAIASVFLGFVYLLGPTPLAAGICTKDLLRQVKSMIKISPQLKHSGCRLYTQNATDFQQSCTVSTLRCFSTEMEVLVTEWKLANIHNVTIPPCRLGRGLQQLANRFSLLKNTTTAECRQCELLQQKEAEEFLQELKGTLEKINSNSCLPEDLK
ncbi:interleukin 15, like [Spinachia spinachia]